MNPENNQLKDGETDVTQIAIICHEANRAYCKTLGDDSQLPWADAPQWQRDSIIAGVEYRLANRNDATQLRLVSSDEQKRKDFLFIAICDAFCKVPE